MIDIHPDQARTLAAIVAHGSFEAAANHLSVTASAVSQRVRALEAAVDKVIEANPDVADKIRDGKVAAAGALIGAVMKEMRGQADAGRVRELILERLT